MSAQALAMKAGVYAYREASSDNTGQPTWIDIGQVAVTAVEQQWRIHYSPSASLSPTACSANFNGCPGAYRSYDLLLDGQRNLIRDLDGCVYRRNGAAVSLPTLPDVAQDGYVSSLQATDISRVCNQQEQAVRVVFRAAKPIDWSGLGGEPGQWEHIFVIDVLDASSGSRIYQLSAGLNVSPIVSKRVVFALTQTDYAGSTGTTAKRLVLHMPLS